MFRYAQHDKCAFTLAETLITLVIIGVVAALTVPTMITKYQKNQFAILAKQTYSIIQNGFKQALAKDGVMKLEDTSISHAVAVQSTSESGEDNFRNEFSKVFKVMAGKQKGDLSEDEIMNITYKSLNGKAKFTPKSQDWIEFRQSFYLVNGSIVYVNMKKNPIKCPTSVVDIKLSGGHLFEYIGWVAFDTNGLKGPNQFGRDLFSVVVSNDGNIFPNRGFDQNICSYGDNTTYNWSTDNQSGCNIESTSSWWSNGSGCLARLIDEGWQMNY